MNEEEYEKVEEYYKNKANYTFLMDEGVVKLRFPALNILRGTATLEREDFIQVRFPFKFKKYDSYWESETDFDQFNTAYNASIVFIDGLKIDINELFHSGNWGIIGLKVDGEFALIDYDYC